MNYEHVNYTTQMFMFLNEKFKLDNRVDTIVQFEYTYDQQVMNRRNH